MATARQEYEVEDDDEDQIIDLVNYVSPSSSPFPSSKPSHPPSPQNVINLTNGFYTDDGEFYSYADFEEKPNNKTNSNNNNNEKNNNNTTSNTNYNNNINKNINNTNTTTTTTTTTFTSPAPPVTTNSNSATTKNTNSTANTNSTNTNSSNGIITSTTNEVDRDVQQILQIFPDCDVDYLRSLILSSSSSNRAQEITDLFLEKRDYKRAKVAEKSEKGFNPDDINKDYYNTKDPVTALYADTCAKVLANKFSHFSMNYIRAIMRLYNSHFLPSLRALEKEQKVSSNVKKALKTPRGKIELPNSRDEQFWQEHEYSRHENILKQEKEDSKLAHQLNEEEYSSTGQLIECSCCFGEYAFDDMAQCPDGHLACGECFRKGAEEVLGSGKTILRCYTAGCNFAFTPSQMEKFLPKKTLEYFQKRQQEEELNQVDIPGLEKCPFCPYAVIIENPDDKVFHCANCKKDSCRLCKEESHIPLRCNEVEKKHNRDYRLYIETQMTNALCRQCNNPRCKKLFFKEEGCNHMKCTCGWEMCYVCRATIKGYDHFKNNGKCVLHEDTKKRNQNDVRTAEEIARAKYLDEHPELAVELAEKEREKQKEKRKERGREREKPGKKRRTTEPITII